MKKFIQSWCVLALFALSVASCNLNEVSTDVSIRFENVSAYDIQLVNINGLVIDEIKAGEKTAYMDFEDVEINSSNIPNLSITANALDVTYTHTYYTYPECSISGYGCGFGETTMNNDNLLPKGNYTITLNPNVQVEKNDAIKELIVELIED
jgi:hypothetical protein